MNFEKLDDLKEALHGSIAKTNYHFKKEDLSQETSQYLPLWMHSADVGGVMEYLYDWWIPASVKNELLEEAKDPTLLKKVFAFAGMTHDIGKHSSIMQNALIKNLPEYSFLGRKLLDDNKYEKLSDYHHTKIGEKILEDLEIPQIAPLVYAHHGNPVLTPSSRDLKRCSVNSNNFNIFTNKEEIKNWIQDWKDALEAIFSICELSYDELPEFSQASQILISGYLIVADWIASNSYYFPLISVTDMGDSSLYPLRIDEGVEKLGFTDPVQSMDVSLSDEDFEYQFGFEPNELQKTLLNILSKSNDPGMVIIEAQMGGGKTEAAFVAAEILGAKNDTGGVFLGLPTQSTANGIFDRFKKWAEQQTSGEIKSFRLVHGLAKQNKNYQQLFHGTANVELENNEHLISHVWMEGRKQALLSDFVIGTIDQALLMALQQKHFMLRHIGLAGKVVILDEIHSFDAYTNEYIDRMLMWLGRYKTPVVLLSATLPKERKKKMIKAYLDGRNGKSSPIDENIMNRTGTYPAITWTDGCEVLQKYSDKKYKNREIELRSLSYDRFDEKILEIIKNELGDGCLGIIVNTVAKAQALGGYLEDNLSDDYEIIVFHSRFINTDRIRIEEDLLDRIGKSKNNTVDKNLEKRKKLIVVGTQVLEQSLDIDFDLMITELSPIELILQRIGRLWRHSYRQRPQQLKHAICYVLGWNDELDPGSKAIYSEYILRKTQKILSSSIRIPEDISFLIEKEYEMPDQSLDAEFMVMYESYLEKIKEKKGKAKAFKLREPCARENLFGILSRPVTGDSAAVEAKVRDGDMSLEVIVVRKVDEDNYTLITDSTRQYAANGLLSNEEALKLSEERLKLPVVFSKKWMINKAIQSLEENARLFPLWLENSNLKGELFLVFDEYGTCELCGETLTYSNKFGLMEVNKNDERK